MIRGGSNATPGLWVIKVVMFARNQVQLQACARPSWVRLLEIKCNFKLARGPAEDVCS